MVLVVVVVTVLIPYLEGSRLPLAGVGEHSVKVHRVVPGARGGGHAVVMLAEVEPPGKDTAGAREEESVPMGVGAGQAGQAGPGVPRWVALVRPRILLLGRRLERASWWMGPGIMPGAGVGMAAVYTRPAALAGAAPIPAPDRPTRAAAAAAPGVPGWLSFVTRNRPLRGGVRVI